MINDHFVVLAEQGVLLWVFGGYLWDQVVIVGTAVVWLER